MKMRQLLHEVRDNLGIAIREPFGGLAAETFCSLQCERRIALFSGVLGAACKSFEYCSECLFIDVQANTRRPGLRPCSFESQT